MFIGYRLKIFVKILFKISSISDAIPNKPSPKARNSSAFWSMIFVKDLFYVAYARNLRGNLHVKSKDLNGPEIYLRFYFPKIFLAKQHLIKDFHQRFLALAQPKK